MSIYFYSNEYDKEYEIDVELHYKPGGSEYEIVGIYEKDLSVERPLEEFPLKERVQIKAKCQRALEEHYFDLYDRLPSSVTRSEKF